MAEIEQGIDIAGLPYDEAITVAMDLLDMDEPEAVLFVQVAKGIIPGDVWPIILVDQNGLQVFPTQ